MRLDFGNIKCIKCDSENVVVCDWNEDLRYEDINEIEFMNEFDEYIKDNFSEDHDQEYLFNCKDCKSWFILKTSSETISPSLLPFSKNDNIPSSCHLLLDPIDLTPKSIQINNVSLPIISYSHSFSNESNYFHNNYGPFYPYPRGRYNLKCSIDSSISKSSSFRIIIESNYPPFIRLEKNIDVEFFNFTIQWYSSEAESILLHLKNINSTMDKVNLDFDLDITDGNIQIRTVPEETSDFISSIASSMRNQQAYRFLNWLENKLRIFIWNEYESIYATEAKNYKWWKGCFPSEVINKIEENQSNDAKIGQRVNKKYPLAYADFDNLLTLLEKEWPTINKKIKKDFDVIRGHFKYMKHFRNSIAHSRYLSHKDIMELQNNAVKFLTLMNLSQFKESILIFYKDF